MKIKQIKEITILSTHFNIVWDKTHNGGKFSFSEERIEIGIQNIKTDPLYVLSTISHELMELILASMGGRFAHARIANNYLFSFDHMTFETAIQLHTELLLKFIHST